MIPRYTIFFCVGFMLDSPPRRVCGLRVGRRGVSCSVAVLMDWDFPIRTLIPTVQRLDYTLVKHHVSD
jgi:hypothetical protein